MGLASLVFLQLPLPVRGQGREGRRGSGVWLGERVGGEGGDGVRLGSQGGGQRSMPRPGFSLNLQLSEGSLVPGLIAIAGWRRPVGLVY